MCTRDKTHHTHTSVHVCHTRRVPHIWHATRASLPSHIPRFLLGEVPRLGRDRANSKGSVALIFVLFRDSFKVTLPFSWWSPASQNSEGPRNYPRSAILIRSLPSVSGRRGDRYRCQVSIRRAIAIVLTFDTLQREYPTKLER